MKNIRKNIFLVLCVVPVLFFSGCISLFPDGGRKPAFAPVYAGPKVEVVVAPFEIKAPKATEAVCGALREILVEALMETNRFIVLERSGLTRAQAPVSGPAGESKQDKDKTAKIIIMAAVVEFQPQTSGGRAGLGGGGGVNSGAFGGLLGPALNKARMALDISIVDISTSEVLAVTHIQGQAADVSAAFVKGSLGGWALKGAAEIYANTPMEKAIRICIVEAVRYIGESVPAKYYKESY